MKTVEVISIFMCMFLVMWTEGDGAPQWRPQGRFGKRFNNAELLTILQPAPEESKQPEPLYLDKTGLRMDRDDLEALYNMQPINVQKSRLTQPLSARWFIANSRTCPKTSFLGVFKCFRKMMAYRSLEAMKKE